jgi:hypothetical protein
MDYSYGACRTRFTTRVADFAKACFTLLLTPP